MVYYNPPITGEYNPLYKLNNQGPLFHCSNEEKNFQDDFNQMGVSKNSGKTPKMDGL